MSEVRTDEEIETVNGDVGIWNVNGNNAVVEICCENANVFAVGSDFANSATRAGVNDYGPDSWNATATENDVCHVLSLVRGRVRGRDRGHVNHSAMPLVHHMQL